MYQFEGTRLNGSVNLLELPVELKRLIYTYCYCPPHSGAGFQQVEYVQEGDMELPDAHEANDDNNSSAYWSAELYTPCQHPRSHLSLYFTCRQLRSELFPVFTGHHVMNMSNVFLAAEEPVDSGPVYRLQDVHHVALRFPPNGNVCACSAYGKGSQQHLCIDLRTNVEKDINNFISTIKSCRDRLRLESVEFVLPLPCNSTSTAFSQYRALLRSVVYLAEALSDNRHETVRDIQRLLLQIKWPANPRNPVKVRIEHISRTSWERISDGTLVLERDCTKCSTMGLPIECHTHHDDWADVDDVLSAIAGDRILTLEYPGVDHPKLWKVIFQPGGGFKYFSHAMIELERRRENFV